MASLTDAVKGDARTKIAARRLTRAHGGEKKLEEGHKWVACALS
jgi:hypothetical protein